MLCAEVHNRASSLVLAQHSTLDFNLKKAFSFKDVNLSLLLSLVPVMCILSAVKCTEKGRLSIPLALRPNRACCASVSFLWELSEPAVLHQRFRPS